MNSAKFFTDVKVSLLALMKIIGHAVYMKYFWECENNRQGNDKEIMGLLIGKVEGSMAEVQ